MEQIIDVIQSGNSFRLILESGNTAIVNQAGYAELLGFNEDYLVVYNDDYVTVLDARGNFRTNIQLLNREAVRVSGNYIYLRDGDYSVRYNMQGQQVGMTQTF